MYWSARAVRRTSLPPRSNHSSLPLLDIPILPPRTNRKRHRKTACPLRTHPKRAKMLALHCPHCSCLPVFPMPAAYQGWGRPLSTQQCRAGRRRGGAHVPMDRWSVYLPLPNAPRTGSRLRCGPERGEGFAFFRQACKPIVASHGPAGLMPAPVFQRGGYTHAYRPRGQTPVALRLKGAMILKVPSVSCSATATKS